MTFSSNAFAVSTDTCNDTDTKLMLHLNGTDGSTTFTDDSTTANSVTGQNQAQIDTAQSKFGGASGLFDGSSDWLNVPDNAAFDIGTSNFTVDFWVRFNVIQFSGFVSSTNASDFMRIRFSDSANELQIRLMGGTNFTFAWTPSTGQWYHVTIIRTGSTIRAFVDGTQIGTDQTDSANITLGNTFHIADDADSGNQLNGWIDEFRIVNGTAVWTANFTPPSAEYTSTCATRRRVIPIIVSQ